MTRGFIDLRTTGATISKVLQILIEVNSGLCLEYIQQDYYHFSGICVEGRLCAFFYAYNG